MIGNKVRAQSHIATAGDVTAGLVKFEFGDAFQVKGAVFQVLTAAGAIKAVTCTVTWDSESVTVTNAGGTVFAATDVISVLAFG